MKNRKGTKHSEQIAGIYARNVAWQTTGRFSVDRLLVEREIPLVELIEVTKRASIFLRCQSIDNMRPLLDAVRDARRKLSERREKGPADD